MIFDAHAHIFPNKVAEKAVAGIGNFYNTLTMELDGTVEGLLKNGGSAGVDRFLVHSVATVPEQVTSINNFIGRSVKKYPDKFVGFAAMHPDFGDVPAELDRAMSLGLKGVKLHPDFQRFNADGEKAMAIYEAAAERGLPVLIHMGDSRTDFSKAGRLVNVLERFPELEVIAAHFGGWSEWDASAEILGDGRFKHLWTDCSSSLYAMSPEHAKRLIDAYGADRVLFGTDYPMWTASEELERFDKIPLTEGEREMILHENAERLLKL
ncbi:MAG: amidohydrolase family protein [Prevotella sp.]|nr:amidohydrolase family protein [Prevotella sp.]